MLPPRIDQDAVRRSIGAYADKQETLEQRGEVYKELLGFVPPRIEARLHVTGALDPPCSTCRKKSANRACTPSAST